MTKQISPLKLAIAGKDLALSESAFCCTVNLFGLGSNGEHSALSSIAIELEDHFLPYLNGGSLIRVVVIHVAAGELCHFVEEVWGIE